MARSAVFSWRGRRSGPAWIGKGDIRGIKAPAISLSAHADGATASEVRLRRRGGDEACG